MPLYLPSEARREILQAIGAKWCLQVFVETGTAHGDTPLFLRHSFSELHTIELFEASYNIARERLSTYPQIHCWLGDSTTVLPLVLRQFQEAALIWLDGHYSGPGSAHGTLDTPIVHELEIIFNDIKVNNRQHVIVIDDARIFAGQPEHNLEQHYADYPSLEWIEEMALNHDYHYTLEDDMVRLFPS